MSIVAKPRFSYRWSLSGGYPAPGIKKNNIKVFGTFICGGGSSMGYKLAGCDHLGGVEIDPQMAKIYKANHSPKYLFVEDIRKFRKRKKEDIPNELFDLDILDGSPPCSSFSMAGSREKGWGKKKKFREGQSEQTLDDLFFEYIALAKRLQPKVVVAENVKGMLAGNAKVYIKKIKLAFEDAGYVVQLFLLNASRMGVPQRRERVVFVCRRKDLNLNDLSLSFNMKNIPFSKVDSGDAARVLVTKTRRRYALNVTKSGVCQTNKKSLGGKMGAVGFCSVCLPDVTPLTVTSGGEVIYKDKTHLVTKGELLRIGSFPSDYNFLKTKPQYVIGMSVPPVMMAHIVNQIIEQWF